MTHSTRITAALTLTLLTAPPSPSIAKDEPPPPPPAITIDGDDNKQYFLFAPPPERQTEGDRTKNAAKLLIILPGGDGGRDFHHFVKRIHESLPEDYLVAQAIAPIWNEDEETRIVWPTRGLPDPNMKFPTEEFIAAIIDDVAKRHPLAERHIYALGWSSGGPPVYAAAMQKETKLSGAFIAMSVFKPEHCPPAENAAGRAFYILHSPQDYIAMRFPEIARDTLTDAGAKVKLETYPGGHGWRGDSFEKIRGGIEWLENNAAAAER